MIPPRTLFWNIQHRRKEPIPPTRQSQPHSRIVSACNTYWVHEADIHDSISKVAASMAHPAVLDLTSFFYPIGNTPAICLTKDIPREIPAKLLLLACGDVRNVLYTCYVDRNASRNLDITCCDIQPAVIARNICILSLILDIKDDGKVQPLDGISEYTC